MQQNLRKRTKFIYFKIINQCAKDGRPDVKDQPDSGTERDRRKDLGPLSVKPSSSRSRAY